MAAFERSAGTSRPIAPTSHDRAPAPLALAPREPAEPMQRALDAWHRDQPEAFARPAAAAAEDPASAADRAIALHHLLAYGRLAAERDLAALRDRAAADGSPVLAPLLRQAEARTAQILQAAPAELHPSLRVGFAPTAGALAEKAAAIDALTAERRRAGALAQSVQLGEALLRQDPEQYEVLVADAGAMADGLGLDAEQHRTLMGRVRERFASATLLAELDPVAGDPAQAEQDLQRGRFRDAFDAEGIAAWRELVAANRARAAAEAARAGHEAGIVAELKMLNRLAAAGRAETPMPAPAEVETVFPGEGAARLAAAMRNRQRSVYGAGIATQPFDRDQAWIEAATSEEDRTIRVEAVQRKQREFAQSGGGNLLAQYPALGEAVEEGLQDPAKLELAVELYQRQLQKLGVPPRERGLLPREALKRLGRMRLSGGSEGGEPIVGGDGQDRYLDSNGAEPPITAPADAGPAMPAPPRPPRDTPDETPSRGARQQWGYPAWLEPQDPAQALQDRAIVQAGGAATLSQDRKIDLLKYWYVQPKSSITDADKLAMRELFMTMPVDPGYLAYEAPIRDRILASIKNDQVVIEGLRNWTTSSREQWLEVMNRIVAHVADAYGIKSPPIVFNEELTETKDGAVTARFVEATEVIEVNPIYLNPPPEKKQLFLAQVNIPARIVEEATHAYQWEIKKQFRDRKIAESDPRYVFAQQVSLQQPWMYIDASEEGLFLDDSGGYERQPTEAHAKLVAREIIRGL